MLTEAFLEDLKQKAEAATPGPWRYHRHHYPISGTNSHGVVSDEFFGEVIASTETSPHHESEEADARYIASANPAVILVLIEHIRRLQTEDDT